ncbi:MAG: hypothetical protein WB643_02400, partial [Candidatus Bathyarchaeia archaeon]
MPEDRRLWRKQLPPSLPPRFQEAKSYLLFCFARICENDTTLTKTGLTINGIYNAMEDAKLPRPGIRLFYRYFRDLARNGYLESTSGRVGSKGALYVMTTKGIELYFSMQGAQTSEKAGLPVKNVSWNVTMRHCQN